MSFTIEKQRSMPTNKNKSCKRKCDNCLTKQREYHRGVEFKNHIDQGEMSGVEFPRHSKKLYWHGSFRGTRDF